MGFVSNMVNSRDRPATSRKKTHMETKITFCRICEATCGIKVQVDDGRLVAVDPDPDHVVSRGYICQKGRRFAATQNDPDRITSPMKRVGDDWVEISWNQAFDEIGAKTRALMAKHGPNTVGHFVGSPAGANVMAPLFRYALWEALGSHRLYGTPSTDTVNKFRVAEDMYGSPFYLTFPDVHHTDFLMIIGANPAISGTSLFHLPHSVQAMRDVVTRGGRSIFINPRRTESSQAGEQVFIRPDTDIYFLAAFCNELIRIDGFDPAHVATHMSGFDALRDVVAAWTPERQAEATGIPAEILKELAQAHKSAKGAALYMSTGVNQGQSGTLCFWLMEAINCLTGNLDHRGGTLMGKGLFDMPREIQENRQYFKKDLRADGLPVVIDNHPSGVLADDILNEAPDKLTALFVEASNPLLACSNPGGRLDKAMSELELLVMIDLFRNETGNLAHYILPATTFLERADIPYALQSFTGNAPEPYMAYTDPVVTPPENVRHEWWIFSKLAEAFGVTMFNSRLINFGLKINTRAAHSRFKFLRNMAVTPETLLDGMLKKYKVGSRKSFLTETPHGILLGENKPGSFLKDRVLTNDGKVDLAPDEYVTTFNQQVEGLYKKDLENLDRFKLITKRELKRINSWMANSRSLNFPKTNYAYIHPDDAHEIDVADGDWIEVTSQSGSIEIPVKVSDEIMRKTVAIPHGWGHADADGLSFAQTHPGVNSNLLAGDGKENVEKLSGMSFLSGILVDLKRTGRNETAAESVA